MHICLQTADILHYIVSQVLPACKQTTDEDASDPRSQALDTYLAMAQTCRHFYEPAMDALWENIPNLEPLLSGLLAQVKADENSRLNADDCWVYFLKNATRVRSLQLSWYQDIREHLQALSEHQRGQKSIFSRLRDLSCTDLRLELTWYLSLFLNPGLIHFRVGHYPPVPPEVTILSLDLLLKTCTKLQTLHCNASHETRTDRTVMKFPDLVDFSTEGGLSPPVFKHFTTLSRLKHLSIGLAHAVSGIPEPSDTITFPQLISLQLSMANDTHGPRLLRLITSKSLRRLKIFFPGASSTKNVREFLDILGTAHPLLTHISIGVLAMHPHDIFISGEPIPIRVFAAFKSLVALNIAYEGISFTEGDIEPLGKGCPQLSHIDVVSGWMHSPLPHAVLPVRALEKLAAHVPHLVGLSVDFDVHSVHDAPPPTARQPTALLDLRLHHNEIAAADALPLAAYISDIYPEADVVAPPYLDLGVEASAMDKLWLTVQQGVALLAEARQREVERFGSQSAS